MSNALAIAAVTETLSNLLSYYLDASGVTQAWVGTDSPDALTNPANKAGINIFLYQVTPNAALRNADLPTRTADGTLLRKPQAALDLHYLLTFYGDSTTLEPQRLLGAASIALQANPVLPKFLIQQTQTLNSFLQNSNLDTQTEQIRFTPAVLTLTDLSNLWQFLFKVEYVLSAAYVASVVLIEAEVPLPPLLPQLAPPPLPALSYSLGVQTMRQLVVTQVVAAAAGAPITADSAVVLIGSNLAAPPGAATQVLINGNTPAPIMLTPTTVTPTSITLTLPPGLAAGTQTAQVMQPLMLGTPPVLHPGTGSASGIAAFVLDPMIAPSSPPGGYAISFIPAFGSPPGPTVEVGIIPEVQAGQRVVLQMVPLASPPAPSFLFDGGTLSVASNAVTIPIPGLSPGIYAVQVLVDGAASQVQYGAGGVPTAPLLTI